MKNVPQPRIVSVLAMIFVLLALGIGVWAQDAESVLYSFTASTDGAGPSGGMISDAAGNLYGTTSSGGDLSCDINPDYGCGVVFELTPNGSGGWTQSVLYAFTGGTDGGVPLSGVILDTAGNLYGTTFAGSAYGLGTVFQLSPGSPDGDWTETVLHSFQYNDNDGYHPTASLILDAAGNLYGTTQAGGGGTYGQGTVFELKRHLGGNWAERVLHSFQANGPDGYEPLGALIFDGAGNLYGTTAEGGSRHSAGTAFQLTPSHDKWNEKVLHSFGSRNTGKDGVLPSCDLIFDDAGNLYGTTYSGGAYGYGTVFVLTPHARGWGERMLHSFNNDGKDGYHPEAGLTFDTAGNLYGTTSSGGSYSEGVVFEITPQRNGFWTETVLHSFGDGTDGGIPYAGLVLDTSGRLYGTTQAGGDYGSGTVVELTP